MAPQTGQSRLIYAAVASSDEVLFEQLEWLVDHVSDAVQCGCSICDRYLRVRIVLLEIFSHPKHERPNS